MRSLNEDFDWSFYKLWQVAQTIGVISLVQIIVCSLSENVKFAIISVLSVVVFLFMEVKMFVMNP